MLTQEQNDWINKRVPRAKWHSENGVINIDGDFRLSYYEIDNKLPVQFGKITGNFYCHNNSLLSFKGFPSEIGGNCWLHYNRFTSLDGIPQNVGGTFCYFSNPFILNDKLFEDIKRTGGHNKIDDYNILMQQLKNQIPIQFGVTDKNVIEEIWQSYMKIFE